MTVDILQVTPIAPWVAEDVAKRFTLHDYNAAKDKEAMLADVGSRIRGVLASAFRGPDRALIQRLPKLEIISIFGVGLDATDVEAAKERDVIVTNTPDVLTHCVADLGMGLTMAVMRRIVEGDTYVRARHWEEKGAMAFGTGLRGKCMGIIGLGRIGYEVAKRAEAFGMTIAYHGRKPKPEYDYPFYDDLMELAKDADVLMLTCPGGTETERIINADVLKALGEKGYVVNISRGSVVDEAALIRALRDKTIAGAASDVFWNEPKIDHAFFDLDNIVLSPHQASATHETRRAMGQQTIANLVLHFDGKPVQTPV